MDNSLYSLNIISYEWVAIPIAVSSGPLPAPRWLVSMFSHETELYIMGGTNHSMAPLGDFQEFRTKTSRWDDLAKSHQGNVFFRRWGFTATRAPGERASVYILGGYGGECVDQIVKISFTSLRKIWWLLHFFDNTDLVCFLSRNVFEHMTQ